MEEQKEITIYDIARKLSLSTATVSRALNDNPVINKNTRKLVQQAANELGYRQNNFASNLRKKKSMTIGVLIHELKSSFMTYVLAGIEKITNEAGYDIIIAHSSESSEKEAANVLNLYHKRVDGILAAISLETKNMDHFKILAEKNIPTVFFDRVEEEGNYTNVIIDNYLCTYEAISHLIDQGCSNFAIMVGNLKRNVYYQRYRGYRDALLKNNLAFREDTIIVNDLSEAAAKDAVQKIYYMNPRPDALFVTNDFTAVICMRELKNLGLRIPEDIAVVGFNNDDISRLVEPPLTTVNYPGMIIGEVAATHLINHLKGTSNLNQMKTVVVKSELIVRESSLKSGKKV